jgi:retinol dehydrogenase 12
MAFVPYFLYSQFFVTPPYPRTDWSSKTVIVTGSNTGVGKEAARHFVRLGAAKVILAVRSLSKGEAAKEDIVNSQRVRQKVIEVWELDLGSFESVKRFAERCGHLERIDAVVENAGIATLEFRKVEGYESMITVNVISTFLLALLLLPKLKETARLFAVKPRLVIVTSEGHKLANFTAAKNTQASGKGIFDALSDEKKIDMVQQYTVSKLLEVLVVRKWAKDFMGSEDYPVILNAPAPGLCRSELTRDWGSVAKTMQHLLARTTEVGSRAFVDAASAGKETHGQFLWDCKVKEPSKLALGSDGEELQSRVWSELARILEGIQPGVTSVLH